MKNQKLQSSQSRAKKEKLQNSGLKGKRPNRFFFRKERAGWVVYDKYNSEIFFVNRIGKEVLLLINKGLSQSEVIDVMSCRYNMNIRIIMGDITPFEEFFK